MSEWFNPPVLVAIILGILAHAWNFWRYYETRNRKKGDILWEEYRLTIDDPLRAALRNSKEIARDLYSKDIEDMPDVPEIHGRLAISLNDIELICAKADGHPESAERDWGEVADCRNAHIMDLLGKKPADMREIREAFRSYEMEIEKRLLRQLKNMKGIR